MKVKNLFRDLDNVDPKDFWTLMSSCDDFKEFSWDTIFNTVKTYLEELENGQIETKKPFKLKMSKYVYEAEQVKILDAIGFDYDHIDYYGNSFIQYCLHKQSSRALRNNDNEKMIFTSVYPTIELIVSKIKNKDLIYNNNKYNENILFQMCSITETGLECEKIDKFLKQYPKFDLHQTNKDNRNLLYQAISQNNYDYAYKLIDLGLSYEIKYNAYVRDKEQKDNYLNVFALCNHNRSTLGLFKIFAKKLDIFPEEGHNVFEHHLNWALSKGQNLNAETRKSSQKWVISMLNMMMEDDIKNRMDNISHALKILDTYQNIQIEDVDFNDIIKKKTPLLKAIYLEATLPEDSEKKTHQKLKI